MRLFFIAEIAVTLLLVGLGVLITIFPPETHNTKALSIFAFLVLALGSGALSFLEKDADDKRESARDTTIAALQVQVTEQTKQIKTLTEFVAPKQSEQVAKSLAQLEDKRHSQQAKQQVAKQKIRELSSSILRFLLDRGEPPMPKSETWHQDVERMIHHSQETMKLYSLSFGAHVIAARNELAGKGLIDSELDNFYEHPTNPIGIRIVGERLGALAERLPD